MWWVVCLLVSVVTVPAASDQRYHHDSYGSQNFVDGHTDEAPPPTSSPSPDALNTLRNYADGEGFFNPRGVYDVQDAINELFSGRSVDFVPKRSSIKDSIEQSMLKPTRARSYINIIADSPMTGMRLMPTRSHLTSSSINVARDWLREQGILRDANANTTVMPKTTETEEPTTVTTATPTTVAPTTTTEKFDIDALLAIVANLTYDYDTNLTEQLNETLQRFSIPTCVTPSTTSTTTASAISTEMWYNTTVVAKCFVCGMDTPGIPRNAYCADAFATDFLPLLPVDARAKGHIARFRKYCRYFDVNNFQHNRSDPRAMLGRWTGGCAVRWIDLSGVYTQRTCRNRLRPATGKHYGSKRMAKLELTLNNLDDGCIISPMATLIPLSRGVSLYARFHACVCSGNWCNRAVVVQQWTACLWLLLLVLVEVVR